MNQVQCCAHSMDSLTDFIMTNTLTD